jgi:2-polyprenyl-3-methyl-5-hydroxy-6-metoxy-1,4-benzoquinol methylase
LLAKLPNLSTSARYFAWAAMHQLGDRTCPACGSQQPKTFLKRKYGVTQLVECQCGLRFRLPRMSQEASDRFYQSDYSQGFTTDCPSDPELETLLRSGFSGSEKCYTRYIDVLQQCGIRPNAAILDFGCSWGYGSWQLSRAGYRVYSYEVSRPRAAFAREKLGCNILMSPSEVPQPVDCLFSAHVIEHLPNPAGMWKLASRVLKPDGKVVAFMPNGDSDCSGNPDYHQWWGLVHPTMLGRKALMNMAAAHGFAGHAYSGRFDLANPEAPLTGGELLFISWPKHL